MLNPAQGLDWISGTGNLEFGSQASGTINLCLLPGIQLGSGVHFGWSSVQKKLGGFRFRFFDDHPGFRFELCDICIIYLALL